MKCSFFWRVVSQLVALIARIFYGIIRRTIVCRLKSCGKNVYIDGRNSYFSARLISIGSDVYIGPGADFAALSKSITIGNKVLFAPNVSIRTDNHDVSCIGRFITDCTERRPQDEEDIVIEDDVWIGTRVIILKGVRIGRGSAIAAGTVLTHSVPPYCIVAGVPGRVIKKRFTKEEILLHEKALYPEHQRLAVHMLED